MQTVNLHRRDADLAVRMVKPDAGHLTLRRLGTLGFGLYSLFRGGDYARSHSNKLMRLRVGLQAVAVILLVVGMMWKATQGA